MFRCDHFTQNRFNELFDKTRSSFSNCFSLLHLNIRSLPRNYDNFTRFLANVDSKFSIMGVTETWLKDSGYSLDIEGYDFIPNPRPSRIGGGVGIYVDNDLEFKLRPDLYIVRSLNAKYGPDHYRSDKSVKFGTELP